VTRSRGLRRAGFDPGWARWVLARRSIRTEPGGEPELAYYVCPGSADTGLEQLIVVAGGRWRIEECFQGAKNTVASSRCPSVVTTSVLDKSHGP
jgi:SRSO17 transposase